MGKQNLQSLSELKSAVVAEEPKLVEPEAKAEDILAKDEATAEAQKPDGSEITAELQKLEATAAAEELKLAEVIAKLQQGNLQIDEIIKLSAEVVQMRESANRAKVNFQVFEANITKAEFEAKLRELCTEYKINRVLFEDYTRINKDADGKETTVKTDRCKINTDVSAYVGMKAKSARKASGASTTSTDRITSRVELHNKISGVNTKASELFYTLPSEFQASQLGTAKAGNWKRLLESAHKVGYLTDYEIATK